MIVLSNVAAPTDGVRLIQGQVAAYIENDSAGPGELTVAESSVTWISAANGQGFSLTYPSIILHAVSRDPSVFPDECLYILADVKLSDIGIRSDDDGPNGSGNDAAAAAAAAADNIRRDVEEEDEDDVNVNGNDDDGDDKQHLAIRFVPQDKTILQHIYQQMCECQELNPDEGDDFSDDFSMDPQDNDSSENESDEEGLNGQASGAGGDHQNILYIQDPAANRQRRRANGDAENISGGEQMEEG